MGVGIEDRILRYRAEQSRRDRQKRQQTKPKQEKEKPEIPDYFSHYNTLTKIRPVDMKENDHLRRMVSRRRDNLTPLYLTLILAQNKDVAQWKNYNGIQRKALKEQSDKFMSERDVMTFMMGEVDLEGKVVSYNDHGDFCRDTKKYDLIVAKKIVEASENQYLHVFERYLRENPLVGWPHPKIIQVKLDEDQIQVALDVCKDLYNYWDMEEDYQYIYWMQVRHGYLISDKPIISKGDHKKAVLWATDCAMSRCFRDMFKSHLEKTRESLKQDSSALQLQSRLSPKGIVIAIAEEKIQEKYIQELSGEFMLNPNYEEKTNYEKLMNALETHFNRLATVEYGKERYTAFAPKSL